MESLGARPLRILAEYLDPLKQLRQEKVGDTIVMFGSARIQSHDKAVAEFEKVKRKAKGRRNSEWRAKIRQARAIVGMSRYYEDARALSHKITSWAMTLGNDPKRFVICSGGGPGIMEAANRGAAEAGGSSVGLSIQLPHEQRPNAFITPELNFCFHYFFMRKLWFAQKAKALIVFPGGFGTMDELWEMLTLLQTGKLPSATSSSSMGGNIGTRSSTGTTWSAPERSANANTRCSNLQTPWTKPSPTSARTWKPTTSRSTKSSRGVGVLSAIFASEKSRRDAGVTEWQHCPQADGRSTSLFSSRDFKRDAGRLRGSLTSRMHFRNAGVSPASFASHLHQSRQRSTPMRADRLKKQSGDGARAPSPLFHFHRQREAFIFVS